MTGDSPLSQFHTRFDVPTWWALFPPDRLEKGYGARLEVLQTAWRKSGCPDWGAENKASSAAGDSPSEGPPEELVGYLRPPVGNAIQGPFSAAYVEFRRMQGAVEQNLGAARVPTDLCLWGSGEGPHRGGTRIGGLPYWPQANPWPVNRRGRPLEFVAQFCFADSRDILPASLPADLLVMFADYARIYDARPASVDALHFAWVSPDHPEAELISREELPPLKRRFAPLHAVLHRTWDQPLPPPAPGELNLAARWAHELLATKIGGVDVRFDEPSPDPGNRFHLLTLETIQPEWPQFDLTIRPSQVPQDHRTNVYWRDAGALHLYLKEGGQLFPEFSAVR